MGQGWQKGPSAIFSDWRSMSGSNDTLKACPLGVRNTGLYNCSRVCVCVLCVCV